MLCQVQVLNNPQQSPLALFKNEVLLFSWLHCLILVSFLYGANTELLKTGN